MLISVECLTFLWWETFSYLYFSLVVPRTTDSTNNREDSVSSTETPSSGHMSTSMTSEVIPSSSTPHLQSTPLTTVNAHKAVTTKQQTTPKASGQIVDTTPDTWITSTIKESITPSTATNSIMLSSTTVDIRVTETMTPMASVDPTHSLLASNPTYTVGVTSPTMKTVTSSVHMPITTAETTGGENKYEEPVEAEGAAVFGMTYIVILSSVGVCLVISDARKLHSDLKYGWRNIKSAMFKRN